jgi:hypothetical protein
MTSTCQFIVSTVSGLSSRKQRCAKAAKSSRSWASSSRSVSGAGEIEAVTGIVTWRCRTRHSPRKRLSGNRLKQQTVIPGRPAGPGPETRNTVFANVFAGLCSWLSGSRAAPAPRNDKVFEFPDSLASANSGTLAPLPGRPALAGHPGDRGGDDYLLLPFSGGDRIPDGTFEPGFELGQDLLVRRADGRSRGGRRARPRPEVQHQVEQDFEGTRIGRCGFVDELLDHRLALGDLACRPSSVIVTGSFSASFSRVVRFFEPGGRPRGLPDWPFLKPAPRGGLQ